MLYGLSSAVPSKKLKISTSDSSAIRVYKKIYFWASLFSNGSYTALCATRCKLNLEIAKTLLMESSLDFRG